jgi:imidazolonepropionase-like amidohydrolase
VTRTALKYRTAAAFALVCAGAAFGQAHDAASGSWVVKAKLVVPVEGASIENGAVRIAGGKIDAIGASVDAAGIPGRHVVEFPEGIVYPGLIDAGSWQGARRERDDQARSFQARNRIADAFDPTNAGFAANHAAGITTVHLMPGNASVIGGRTAVVKVGTGGEFRLLAADAGLKISFVESAYPEGRPPTSVLGALAALRDAEGDLAAELQPFGKGAKPVFVAASTNREVMLAAGLRGDLGFRTVLVADQNCGLFSKALQDGVAGVILDALVLNRQPFERGHLNDLMATNLPIAFATWAPFKSPGSLRLSAAIAARLGLPADRVLRALTLDAAKVLGVDAQIGSLKAGKDADLIVLSAPITDARARLLLCVQDGKVVFRAKKEGSS